MKQSVATTIATTTSPVVPGFTEVIARATLDLQDLMIRRIQRYIKRQVERSIFNPMLRQSDYKPLQTKVRLKWGSLEQL